MFMDKLDIADYVFKGESVFIGNTDQPIRTNVAVKGNRIIEVSENIDQLLGPETRIIECGENLVLPGFHDSHVHLMLAGLFQTCVNLQKAVSEEETAQLVKEFADNRPDDPWVLGFTWYHVFWENKRMPHKSTLDRLISDRPVFLLNYEGHGAWVNSKALEICGIDRNTPDPEGGEIERDSNGEPTGILYENAMGLVSKYAYDLSEAMQASMLRQLMSNAVRKGVTSICDMQPFIGADLGDPELYERFEQSGELSIRINITPELTSNLDKVSRLRKEHNSGGVKFSGLKQFVDGVATTHTAYMLEPYADAPGNIGSTVKPLAQLREWIVKADGEGFRIRLHACGDGAVRASLDFFEEAARINGKRDARHTIEHIENIHPDDIKRFAELGVIASMQPEHLAMTEAFEDDPYPEKLGSEREKLTWPIKSLMDAGAEVTLGTDCPVVDLDPFVGIYRALTRVHNDGKPDGGWNPKEKIDLATALRGFTQAPSYMEFREDELGTLEPGKLADIIVLDRNLFTTPVDQIRETAVRITMMDGKIVYEK
jgi:predicted amidohydrolase YtcJ